MSIEYTEIRSLVLIIAVVFASFARGYGQDSTNPTMLAAMTPVRIAETVVVGFPTLDEENPIGGNQQPEWTTRRRFTTTRIYVQPPWQVEAEIGYDGTAQRMGEPLHLFQQELEIGLPYRFQLDVENANANFKGDQVTPGKWRHVSNSVELRYALAEWGSIPLNPTFNAEWRFNDGAADAYEFNLLLGDALWPRCHWGMNLFFEQQIGDDRVREFAVSQAVGYTLIDQKLSAGAEMKIRSESDKDSRNKPENSFQLGPSFQWRPSRRIHLDVVPLVGFGHSSPQVELFVFFGIDFGPGSKESDGAPPPASLRGK